MSSCPTPSNTAVRVSALGTPPRASILRVRVALEQATRLELVARPDHRARIHAGALAEGVLGDRALRVEHVERAPHLRSQPQRTDPLGELLLRHVPQTADQEAGMT